uniref:Gypsy retrotransposon integrase-like protein 1 n=1 Tax=Sinocyclocheilus rhinocerous TaxID=307959 RepID=A0A673L7L2_9TELE
HFTGFVRVRLEMDAIAYKEMFDFKHSGKLPEGISRNAKIVFHEVLHYVRRKEGGALARVVCTKEKAKYIFMELHNSAIGAHCGIHKTLDAVSRRFYWPGMSVDIKKWVSAISCVRTLLLLASKNNPWEIVGMDLVGKLTPTKDGYQYICVMVDYFTKWCEAFPLKSKRAEEVTECIIKLFYKFGAPKRLLTDQGTEFVNQVSIKSFFFYFNPCDSVERAFSFFF